VIPIAVPSLGDTEARAAQDVILSGWLMQGPRVAEFERRVADYCAVAHAVAVSSCTTALQLALQVLGICPGDEVICPSLSFIATANSIRHAGARPVFADIEETTYNLDPESVDEVLSPRTRAILVVHQIGLPADLDRFLDVGRKRGVAIIEDAACALGSRYRGQPIGGHSEMACFSFHPRKVITTGEGGLVTTNNADHARKLLALRQHGMEIPGADRPPVQGIVSEGYDYLGYNYRMTDVQAAIGIEQMKRLDGLLARRRELARRYDAALAHHAWLRPPVVPDYAEATYQSYAVRLAADAPLSRNALVQRLLDRGIHARRGVMLAHREAPYRDLPLATSLYRSERASDYSLLLPIYPTMTDEQQGEVIRALDEAFLQAPGRAA
jgi:dTDP-4-amino-4,6-dideoxygalactose transaminase